MLPACPLDVHQPLPKIQFLWFVVLDPIHPVTLAANESPSSVQSVIGTYRNYVDGIKLPTSSLILQTVKWFRHKMIVRKS